MGSIKQNRYRSGNLLAFIRVFKELKMKSISLWDIPTRLFHWLLVLTVTGSTVNLGGTWMSMA